MTIGLRNITENLKTKSLKIIVYLYNMLLLYSFTLAFSFWNDNVNIMEMDAICLGGLEI